MQCSRQTEEEWWKKGWTKRNSRAISIGLAEKRSAKGELDLMNTFR